MQQAELGRFAESELCSCSKATFMHRTEKRESVNSQAPSNSLMLNSLITAAQQYKVIRRPGGRIMACSVHLSHTLI